MALRNKNKEQKTSFLGLKLTRRGWNNVLIYVILAIVLLFWQVTPDQSDQSDERVSAEQPTATAVESGANAEANSEPNDATEGMKLFPEVAIVELSLPEIQVQATAEGWQQSAPNELSQQQLANLVATWQQLEVVAAERRPRGEATEVAVRLEDGRPLLVIALYTEPTLLLQLAEDDTIYRITSATAAELLAIEQTQ